MHKRFINNIDLLFGQIDVQVQAEVGGLVVAIGNRNAINRLG
jgi:hypothetical protein